MRRIFSATLALSGAVLAPAPLAAQEALTAPGPEGSLSGTLTRVADDAPLVLIVPGSGPTDRDGNNPMGVAAASYRLLAEALAARGIGTLRIDKRGLFGSRGAIADANAVTVSDYVADVVHWVEAARDATGRGCVWLLGHSEGGVVALAAAQESEHLCGLVLVATPGRPLGTVLREQMRANPANAPLLGQIETAIAAFEVGERVDVSAFHSALQGLFAPQVQGFLIDLMAQDPAAMARAAQLPLLIVQGGNDFQTPPADGEALAAAAPAATYLAIPAMNHVLKEVAEGDMQANRASYADPSLPVSSALVEGVASFVSAHRTEHE